MAGGAFDTIHHEHFCYLLLLVVGRIFGQRGLVVHDVEELPTRGGSPRVHARHVPASRIPIRDPVAIIEARPDFVLILPWNLRDEAASQMPMIRGWGGRFVTPIPSLQVS